MADTFSSLDKQIAEIEASLRLIDERLSEFVSPTDPQNLHLLERRHNERFRELMDRFMPSWQYHRDQLNRLPVSHAEWMY